MKKGRDGRGIVVVLVVLEGGSSLSAPERQAVATATATATMKTACPAPFPHPRPDDLLHFGPEARQARVRDAEDGEEQADGCFRRLPRGQRLGGGVGVRFDESGCGDDDEGGGACANVTTSPGYVR